MNTTNEPSSKKRLAGWILSGLISAMLIGPSAISKFVEWEGKAEMFEHLGYTNDLIMKIGVVEIVLAILLMIPHTGFLAAILLTGYLGGATATHVRVGDAFYFPIILGMVMWVAMGLRHPEIFKLAFRTRRTPL